MTGRASVVRIEVSTDAGETVSMTDLLGNVGINGARGTARPE